MWRDNDEENSIHDFSGLTMYFTHERFYDTFLNLNESNDIDRELAGRGAYILAPQWLLSKRMDSVTIKNACAILIVI